MAKRSGPMNIGRKKWIVLLITGLAVLLLIMGNPNPDGGTVWAQDKEETVSPKVTKIVLYKHGMGYFERTGTVKGDATITLDFKTEQMKDLLTSLFAIDEGGGRITTVGYDSKDPIDKQLENILIRVPEGAALTQFLAQLKGAKVEVKIGNDTARGNILGIEPVVQRVDNMAITAYKFVLLTEEGEIKPFNLLEISSLKLLDDPIQKDLKRVLDIYLNSKYTDRKQVKLNCLGKGERDIKIGYLIEMPIWKTSYRLIMPEGEKKKPFLQGWAILENPTDEDWENVQMSFVAGNPISFSMDLYTSYYPQRPVISLTSIIPLVGALFDPEQFAPAGESYQVLEESNEMEKDSEFLSKGLSRPMPVPSASPKSQPSMTEMLLSSVSSLATGVQVGELFSYDSKSSVSISRHKAAMVPIITDEVEGNKVLYYRSNISPRLMNSFYITNSTKLTLETGPVTFFE
ncbi:MAG: hypothetical protein AAB019_05190, partial [Planctomycetota bacterium]